MVTAAPRCDPAHRTTLLNEPVLNLILTASLHDIGENCFNAGAILGMDRVDEPLDGCAVRGLVGADREHPSQIGVHDDAISGDVPCPGADVPRVERQLQPLLAGPKPTLTFGERLVGPTQVKLRHHGAGERSQRSGLLLTQALWAWLGVENAKRAEG